MAKKPLITHPATMPDPPRATMRHPKVRRITVFDSAQRPIYTFKPERPEELTVVIEIAPDGAAGGLS